MERRTNRLNWVLGGTQGSGVDTAANLFARSCAFGGLHVYGQREYYSNIMGEHSYFQVRISERPVGAPLDRIDLLVSFDAETVFLHALNVVQSGGIIYDAKLVEIPIDRVPALDARPREDLRELLRAQGRGRTLGDLLSVVSERGVRLYPVPYDELAERLAEEQGEPLSKVKRTINTMAVAASCALLDYDIERLAKGLQHVFKGKKKIVDLNVRASELTYEHRAEAFDEDFPYRIEPIETDEQRMYVNGNQAVAMGKLLAGCSFQTYYPISPATDESVYLEAHEIFDLNEGEKGAILVLQTEDELSAVNTATGAAIAGARAATSTSGPGFSLMIEGLGFAAINEVPLVITLYQRGGPSTGMPTRSEQGDLRSVIHAGHGEAPRIVLASGDLEEAFYDEIRAFNWAERYQAPVIHMLDKSLASSSQTRPFYDWGEVRIDRGHILSAAELSQDGHYRRFQFTDSGISPRTVLGVKGGIFWKTSDEHDEEGHITEDPVVRVRMMDKRMRKLETAAHQIPTNEKLNVFGDPHADTVIISWGSTKGVIAAAMEQLSDEGIGVRFVQVRLLWPFPAGAVREHLTGAQRVIAVENNYSGQLAGLVREQTGVAADHLIVKYNGRPMSVEEVYEALKAAIAAERRADTQTKRVVLQGGT